MVNCAICGTPGVNKSTCPIVLKNHSEANWKKHHKADRKKPKLKIVKPKPSQPKPSQPKPSQPKPSQPKPSQPKPSQPKKGFDNPYIKKSALAQKVKNKVVEKIQKAKQIVLTGNELKHFFIAFDNPDSFSVKINRTEGYIKEINKTLQLIVDIYVELSKLKVDRVDYFSKPTGNAKTYIDILTGAKNKLIEFIVKHNDGGGGGVRDRISFDQPLDTMIKDMEFMQTMNNLNKLNKLTLLPSVPTTEPSLPKVIKEKKAIALPGRKTKKRRRTKKKSRKTKKKSRRK
jgi:hypothetical protein